LLNARLIAILPKAPRDMDKTRGKVAEIKGNEIVVNNDQGSQRIVTDDKTRFRMGLRLASLEDIEIDDPVLAIGEAQSDGSLRALLVTVVTGEQLRRHTLRGNVLSVDVAAGTLTVEATGHKEGLWSVETTAETRYRVRGVENPSLADIAVGDHVGLVGRATDAEQEIGVARLIVVIPDEFKDSIRVRGEVTAIGDQSFTLSSLRGEFNVLIQDDTRYRTRGDQDVSFAELEVGANVVVIGEPQGDSEIQAKVIGIRLK
jgi:hypothetical protein